MLCRQRTILWHYDTMECYGVLCRSTWLYWWTIGCKQILIRMVCQASMVNTILLSWDTLEPPSLIQQLHRHQMFVQCLRWILVLWWTPLHLATLSSVEQMLFWLWTSALIRPPSPSMWMVSCLSHRLHRSSFRYWVAQSQLKICFRPEVYTLRLQARSLTSTYQVFPPQWAVL